MVENIRTNKIKNVLKKRFMDHRIHHSYLISGPDKTGKLEFARELAKILECKNSAEYCDTCPDCKNIDSNNHIYVLEIRPESEGKSQKVNIPIKQIFDLKKFLAYTATDNYYKIIIIEHADNLSIEAQNSLLKILEEPTPKSIITLLTSKPNLLLSTIHSRSQKIKLTAGASSNSENSNNTLASLLGNGRVKAIEEIENLSEEEQDKLKASLASIIDIPKLSVKEKLELAKAMSADNEKIFFTLNSLTSILHDQIKNRTIKRDNLGSKLDLSAFGKNPIKTLRLVIQARENIQSGFGSKLILENLFINL